jgi:hypothetical protein
MARDVLRMEPDIPGVSHRLRSGIDGHAKHYLKVYCADRI